LSHVFFFLFKELIGIRLPLDGQIGLKFLEFSRTAIAEGIVENSLQKKDSRSYAFSLSPLG